PLTYSISGGPDQSLFNINSSTGVLTFKTAPNFEAPGDVGTNNVYNLQVRVTDGNNPVTQDLIITVTDVNEAPTGVSLTNTTPAIAENTSTTNRTKVADINITDDALGTETITLTGADAASFEVDGNALYLKAGTVLNHEAKSSYTVTINVDDATVGNTPDVSTNFTLSVTNVNEAPSFAAPTATFSTPENTTAVGTITPATDPDAGDNLTYTLSGADAAKFNFDATSRVLSFKTAPNFEAPGSVAGTNAYSVTVTAIDTGGLTATQTVTVNVTNVNEAPSFAAPTATFSTPENSTSVGTITPATDPDAGSTLTYSLSGADAAKFNLDTTSRVLTFKNPPNFEAPGSAAGTNAYTVTVTATDGGGLTATQTVTVNVTDVVE
ncbi:cadherin domain-containing protein, partial [Cylindrospermopsis raciborskii]